ncbi:MAG: Omp28-related outer membrane protein [Bacteroidetes bacterium]|nr:MAG: Omp28-related outer membrane protein [Bacteroidota bacterium]
MKHFLKYYLIPYTLYLIPCSLFLSACDKVENPYLPETTGGGDTSTVKVRKVLIEEFTGHQCGNCPPAAQTIHTLQINPQYEGKIIAVTIHSGSWAQVTPPLYTADFHCNEGDAYFTDFEVAYNPVGMVNRKDHPANDHLKDVGEWGGLVSSILAVAPDADIQIINTYYSGPRQLSTSVRCKFLNALNGTYKIVLLLTEDSIVSPQKDYTLPSPSNDTNYVHRHLLRGGITSSYGDTLVSGNISSGDTVVRTFNYTLPVNFNNTAPDPSHCYVVAYIYDAATYEIIQVEEKKIN